MRTKTRIRILFSSLLFLGSLLLVPTITHVNGQFTGIVCIVPTSASSCPSSSSTIGGTAGTQLRVSIFLQTSDGLNAFSVILFADHTILKPASADLTGSVLIQPRSIIVECLGGTLVQGSTCSSVDTADTLEFVAAGAPGLVTASPTTGLLFTAIYNVTASTNGTPIRYQTGCSGNSVAGTTICVDIANGGIQPVPETVQTAIFTTSPDFTLTNIGLSTITVPQGNFCATDPINVTSINSFSGTVTLTSSVFPSSGPASTMTPGSVSLAPGQSTTTQLTLCATPSTPTGSYTANVTGTSGAILHSLLIPVTVTPPPDFTISASPASLSIPQGNCGSSTITVTSVNGFSGGVSLSATVSPTGPSVALNPTSVSLSAGGSASSTLTVCTTSSTAQGTYTVTVTGTSGTLSHSTTVSVTVTPPPPPPDFTITITPSSQPLQTGSTTSFTVTISSVNGFNGNVNLAATVSPSLKHPPTTSLPGTVGPNSSSTLTVIAAHNTTLGTYTITVTATSGSLVHSASVTVNVTH